jgi:superfamily I DNA/RNA helicase
MPADPPLTDDERRVLEVLMQPNRGVADRTVEKIGEAVGMTWTPTWEALRSLESRLPQLARPDVEATLDIQFWRTTSHAADAMEEG